LDYAAKRRNSPLDTTLDADDDACPSDVPARLVPHLDGHLVTQPERLDHRVQQRSVGAAVDQRAERHVAGDAGETVEIRDRHARVLLMRTAAASMGCMLAGRLATRTETASTRGRLRTRSANAAATPASKVMVVPSSTSLAAARAYVS